MATQEFVLHQENPKPPKERFVIFSISVSPANESRHKSFHLCLSPTEPLLPVLLLFPRSWIVVDNFFSLCFGWVVVDGGALIIV